MECYILDRDIIGKKRRPYTHRVVMGLKKNKSQKKSNMFTYKTIKETECALLFTSLGSEGFIFYSKGTKTFILLYPFYSYKKYEYILIIRRNVS